MVEPSLNFNQLVFFTYLNILILTKCENNYANK